MDAETAVQAGGMGPLVWWAETPAPVHPAGARAWRSCDPPPPPKSGLRKSSWLDQPSVSHGLRGGGLEDGCDPIGGKALSSEMHPHLRLRTVRFLQAT